MKEKCVISSYIAAVESIDATFLGREKRDTTLGIETKPTTVCKLPEILDVAAKTLPKVPRNCAYFV